MTSTLQNVQIDTAQINSLDTVSPQITIVAKSSATEAKPVKKLGKAQETPKIESTYHEDAAFIRIVDAYLSPSAKQRTQRELAEFADTLISDRVLDWLVDTEARPVQVQRWNSWGENKDQLVTSHGWKNLWHLGISEKLGALPLLQKEYGNDGRVIQMLKCNLFSPSSATSSLHLTFSDGIAALLQNHLKASEIDAPTRRLFQYSYDKLTSNNPNESWSSGLWMTERLGGSDLTPTETTAIFSPQKLGPHNGKDADGFPLGPWILNGFKWFSTGTEPSMAIAVARTAAGLSTFYVPMRRATRIDASGRVTDVELNGIRIRRVKQKAGTKALPTSELELTGVRAYLIGKEGKGMNEIGAVLNLTRIHLAVTMLGYAGRALSAARAFAKVRKVARGTRLSSVPLHMRTLAKLHITYRAHMATTFFATALLAKSENTAQSSSTPRLDLVPKDPQDAMNLLRLLGSVVKATGCMDVCFITQSCMESMGGVGYCENDEIGMNVARLWRDSASCLIGEGTTDVIAIDVIKVLKGKLGESVLTSYDRWMEASLPKAESMAAQAKTVTEQWSELRTGILSNSMDYLTMNAREIMQRVQSITAGVIFLADAAHDNDPVVLEVAKRWLRATSPLINGASVGDELKLDQQIVFGDRPTWVGVGYRESKL